MIGSSSIPHLDFLHRHGCACLPAQLDTGLARVVRYLVGKALFAKTNSK